MSFTRSLDLPAREALELARRPARRTFLPALAGLGLLSLASALGSMLGMSDHGLLGLRAAVEALAIVVPALLVATTYADLDASPRAVAAATAIGLLTGGIVAASLVPLSAFLALVDRAQGTILADGAAVIPMAALIATAAMASRVIRAIDRSARASWIARGFGVVLLSVFALRVVTRAWPHLI